MKKIVLYLFIFGMLFVSCDELGEDVVCPSIFTSVYTKVLTTDEEPVVLDRVSVFDKQSGKEFDLCETGVCADGKPSGTPEAGVYVIFHDGFVGEIGRGERTLIVEGQNAEISFQEEFRVKDNGCQIEKTAGPDTLIVPSVADSLAVKSTKTNS